MGINNRERRKARKVRDQRRRQAGPAASPFGLPGAGPSAREVAESMILAAGKLCFEGGPATWQGHGDALVEGLGLPHGQRLVDRVLLDLLQQQVEQAWAHGWQPADLVRVARREYGRTHVELLIDVIAGQMRAYSAATVDPRWAGQLAELDATVWWKVDADWASAWADRHGLDRAGMVRTAIPVFALIGGLPTIPLMCPPPGHASTGDPAQPASGGRQPRDTNNQRGADDARMLDRIRALLAKAESTTFAEEAETYTAKAQELMARYSIDAALLAARERTPSEPGAVRLGIDAPYEAGKSMLLGVVANANRCRAVWSKSLGFSTVIGYPTDLDLVELLYTSLLVQATTAMTAEGSKRDRYGRSSTRSFRQSFLTAYAERVGERLTGAARQAGEQAATEVGRDALLPVLSARDDAVREKVEKVFPEVRYSTMSVTNRQGWISGRAAADRASLHPHQQLDG